MALNLVSLEQASDHLRRDTSDDDNDLLLKIAGASRAILNYLGEDVGFIDSSGEIPVDSDGNPIGVPEEVQQATLLMIGVLYTDRDAAEYVAGNTDDRLGKQSLPRAVHWMLDPLRTPRIA